VPGKYSKNLELGFWVRNQRRRRLKMSKDRVFKLNSIGFTWEVDPGIRWEIMFEELRKFKDSEGHCNVPGKYSKNPELGFCVSRQRVQRSKISKERASKLDSIGFTRVFDLELDVRWEIMFEELRKFKEREGHCNVPSSYSDNPELGRWVSRQRGQRLKMSNERASKLDSVAFTWGRNPNARWEKMFEELRKFKDTECHCNVPVRFSDNPKLGTWVHSQRSKRLKISKERASKLDSIGFTWDRKIEVR